jgi:hypothetical protein
MSLEQQPNEKRRPESSEAFGNLVDLNNSRVQRELAKMHYPDATNPMMEWLTPDNYGISMAQRYGGYREERGDDTQVDLSNESELKTILKDVSEHAPDTLH